ncbi:hypothetical protein Tco_1540994 [Tanacetum coccineum]
MSDTNNNNMQTQTSSALRNAIMKAGGIDRPPMLAPDKMETKDTVSSFVMKNTCFVKENSNSETAFSKSAKESSLDSETKDVHVLSKEDLKGTRIEHGFKQAFMSLFGQDDDTFTITMFLNVDQLQKQLDKDEFQEDGSMADFWVLNNQFQ